MATDDREEQFERALAKHLREAAEKACPDAETLAAYHERTLSLEEMAKWKEHIAGCERCQETLALVEQAEVVDREDWKDMATQALGAAAPMMRGEATTKTEPVELPKRGPRAQWKWIAPISALAAGVVIWIGAVEIQKQHKQADSVQVAENRQATAEPGAPGMVVTPAPASPQENGGPAKAGRDEGAKLSVPAASRPNAKMPANAASPMSAPGFPAPPEVELDKKDKKRDAASRTGFGNGSGRASAPAPAPATTPAPSRADALGGSRDNAAAAAKQGGALQGMVAGVAGGRVNPAPPPPNESGATLEQKVPAGLRPSNLSTISGTVLDPSGAAINGAVISAVSTSSGKTKTASADASGKFTLTDLPSDQYRVVVAQAGFAASEQTLTLEPRQSKQLQVQLKLGSVAETVEVSAGAAPVLNTESAEVSATKAATNLPLNSRNFNQLVQLAAANPQYIVAPDGKLAWRVGEAGKIERSSDHGKTWKPQASGVFADLRTGSATSSKVCWVIGKAGTILLTADGGKHWKPVASPIAEDLGGIHATDALHASIWDIPNQNSFETSDGGVTWKRIGNE